MNDSSAPGRAPADVPASSSHSPTSDTCTLRDLQRRAGELLADVRHPRLGSLAALVEEVGELAQELMQREVYKQPPTDAQNLRRELADILLVLMELADHYEVDLQSAMNMRLDELAPKVPGWREKFGAALREARKRCDEAVDAGA